MTSFDVVAYLRRLLGIKKIGHTGTLDPEAVGVLPICAGNATKAIEYLTEKDKLYRAELTLGVSTDTQDASGKIIEENPVNCMEERIREVFSSFHGKYMQVPPMYSAVKVGGKKLYELAREGVTVERSPREVEIHFIRIVGFPEKNKVLFDVKCSKGTYVRTLCADIGQKLGCGGHMSFLVRLASGAFDLSSARSLEDIERMAVQDKLHEALIPIADAFKDYTKVILDAGSVKRLCNGMAVRLKGKDLQSAEMVAVYDESGHFFAIGEIMEREKQMHVKSKKLFM